MDQKENSINQNQKNNIMKNLILFAFACLLLASCGGAGKELSDNISVSQAMHHCAHTFYYWLWIVITAILFAGLSLGFYVNYKQGGDWTVGTTIILIVVFALLITAILMRPCEIAANTTVEQAARGAFIGY
jgi:peptidoglycan/LPS O-acetylase OafA/YrhL